MKSLLAFSSLLLFAIASSAQRPAGFTSSTYAPLPAPVFAAARTPQPIDVADSLYRLGKSALTDGDYKKAATTFQLVVDRFPDSDFAADALYFRAYALFRSGTSRELDAAVVALDRQVTRYPKAATLKDAAGLRASIRSEQAKRGDATAFGEISQGATTLKNENRCPTDDDDMRMVALNGIAQNDPDLVLSVSQKILARTDECSVRLRKRAVYMVAQTREEERSEILLKVASSDPSLEVRREGVQWLAEVNTERAAKALDSILFNAGDAEIRDRALYALSRHKSPAARASLRRFAESPSVSTDLRLRAVNYIGDGRRTSDDVEFLRGLFGRTASPELREAIVRSIASIKTPDRSTWLLSVARDKQQELEVRKQALHYAGQNGVELKDVLALYEEFAGQPQMQDQMLYVYSQRREVEATDKLMQVARSEKNPDLRKKAIFYLGTKKDPRVKQFLLDLISQ